MRSGAALGIVLVAVVAAVLVRSLTTKEAMRPNDAEVAGEATCDLRAEFEAYAEQLYGGTHPTYGKGRIPELRRALAQLGPEERDSARHRDAAIDLARELLRLGQVERAVALLDEVTGALPAAPPGGSLAPEDARVYFARALAHLRRAELENCVRRHDGDCCIFPLQGGGVHSVSEPARLAREDLLTFLRHTQGVPSMGRESVTAIWLLNVACMALGEYPDNVPEGLQVTLVRAEADAGVPRFVDAAPRLGVSAFDHAGGALVDDFDGDGRLDLVSSSSDPREPMQAFRNVGDGSFEDVGAAWDLDQQLGGLNLVGADHDNDGDLDVLVLRGAWLADQGRMRNSLLRNDDGHGFTDVTRATGLAEPAFPTQTAVWADFDGDGWLDLYVGNEADKEEVAFPCQLFASERGTRFGDVAGEAGVTNERLAKGVTVGDYDRDGDVDLYVSNIGPNRMFRNDGPFRFTDVTAQLGVAEPAERSFACWFFDRDEDGDLDLWVNAYRGQTADVVLDSLGRESFGAKPCLYENTGDGFRDIAAEVGIDRVWLTMGSSFGDMDGDGWLDVYLGTGDPAYETIVPNVALHNEGGVSFRDVTVASGLGHLQKGHGVVFADVDDDGDQDLFHQLGGFFPDDGFQNTLFLNPGGGHRHLVLELVGVRTNRMAVGTHLAVDVVTPSGPRTIHRDVGSISSFGAAPRRQEIGLGDAREITSLHVRWPSGVQQRFTDLELDARYRVREDGDDLERLPTPAPVPLGPESAGAPPRAESPTSSERAERRAQRRAERKAERRAAGTERPER